MQGWKVSITSGSKWYRVEASITSGSKYNDEEGRQELFKIWTSNDVLTILLLDHPLDHPPPLPLPLDHPPPPPLPPRAVLDEEPLLQSSFMQSVWLDIVLYIWYSFKPKLIKLVWIVCLSCRWIVCSAYLSQSERRRWKMVQVVPNYLRLLSSAGGVK